MKKILFPLAIFVWLGAASSISYAQGPRYSDQDTMAVLDNYAYPGDTVGIVLYMANTTVTVGGFRVRLVYNDTLLQALSVQCTDRGCNLETFATDLTQSGVVRILAYSMQSNTIPHGSGPVAIINFLVRLDAIPGSEDSIVFEDEELYENSWSDSLGTELIIPQLIPGNFLVIGGGFNQPPVIGNIGNQEVAEGQTLQFNVVAHDPDADPITLTANNLPPNATFPMVQGDSVVTGTFTFSPTFDQGPDTFFVDFVATDDHNNVTTRTVQIVVLDQPNDVLSIDQNAGGVPGATGRVVGINLFNAQAIFGVQFDYLFDPSQIRVTDVAAADRGYNMLFWYGTPEPGRIRVLLFSLSLDSLSGGSGPIVNFTVDVDTAASFGPTPMVLDSAIEVIDSTGLSKDFQVENASFTVDQFGDANLDGFVNVGDCISLIAYIVGLLQFDQRQYDAADFNRDGQVDIADLQDIINLILGIQAPPPVPPNVLVEVELVKDVVPSGDLLSVPLWADIGTEASAVQFEATYNPENLEEVGVSLGEMAGNMQLEYSVGNGAIRGVVYNLGGASFGPSVGDLLRFEFRVLDYDFELATDVELTEFLIVDPAADFIPTEVKGQLPEQFALHQNYPNPFNATTNISFDLPKPSFAELAIYDLLGRKVITLVSDYLPAGSHLMTWDGRSQSGEIMASGVYFYRLQASEFDETRKMLLVK